jgi:endoglucanase
VLGGAAGVAAAGLAVLTALLAAPAAQAGSLPSSMQFYADPNAQAARWVAANPGDSRASAINSRIAQVPSGIWFSNYQPGTIASDVSAVTSAAAAAGKTPVLVVYDIPNRDCGGASAGGAPDLASYATSSRASPPAWAADRSSSSWNPTRWPCRPACPVPRSPTGTMR